VGTVAGWTILRIKQLAGGDKAATVVKVASTLKTVQRAVTAIAAANLKDKASINGGGDIKQQAAVEPTSATAREW